MKQRVANALLVLIALLIAGAGSIYAKDTYDWIVAKRLTVSNATDLQSTLSVGSAATFDTTLDVTGAATFSAAITQADGDLTVADDLSITAQTTISVTNSAAFTPTGSYQPIESAGTVTPSIATGAASAGDVLTLINTSDTTVNIADSGTAKLSAAAALGQYDALILWFDGTNWIEISRSDN